ncbi:hypothetical protein [Caulobacter endophyticus]|uniref:Uncharacterized protein n=1 Tax=Caulobacter endophyticus TaxID=2172652 RepID=A0A2T9JGY9_9CAUL|nr:hypothetical protein [Caulobacter endophyticus]PVM82939.1 hypothetical protein DDF67_21875 [Caulobacter endophyticus]
MASVEIDYEEKLFLALAALRGAGYAPVRLVLDRAERLGPTSIERPGSGAARALDMEVEFQPDAKPHILACKDDRTLCAPVALRQLARWLAADGGEREPMALIPAYSVPRLRAVR